jgi:hypothetical protein
VCGCVSVGGIVSGKCGEWWVLLVVAVVVIVAVTAAVVVVMSGCSDT